MKFINALVLPVTFAKINPKFQTPDQIFKEVTEKSQQILETSPLVILKSAGNYPTHDPTDFEGEHLINLSENLSNARNVLMSNPEIGVEESDNKCGWHGCESTSSHYFDASYAINGKPMRESELFDYRVTGFDIFYSYSQYSKNTAFVADIADNPTVDFVKVWPPINSVWDYIRYADYHQMRVFVNDVECLAIDNYNNAKIWAMINDSNGYNYTAAIYKCEVPVENAYTIRAHKENGLMAFKEIEIYAPTTTTLQQNLVEIPVDQAGSLSALNSMKNNLAVDEIVSHGCHCSKYSNNKLVGGYVVDEMDSMCRMWNSKRRCLTLPGGACENGIDFKFFN